jgi:hypothetical protein
VFLFNSKILVWKTNFDLENLLREFPQQQQQQQRHQTNLKESTSELNSPVAFQVDARKDVIGENLPDIHVSWKSSI